MSSKTEHASGLSDPSFPPTHMNKNAHTDDRSTFPSMQAPHILGSAHTRTYAFTFLSCSSIMQTLVGVPYLARCGEINEKILTRANKVRVCWLPLRKEYSTFFSASEVRMNSMYVYLRNHIKAESIRTREKEEKSVAGYLYCLTFPPPLGGWVEVGFSNFF